MTGIAASNFRATWQCACKVTGNCFQGRVRCPKLKEMLSDIDDGLAIAPTGYTVADAVQDWLAYGLNSRDKATVTKLSILARIHVIPALGARKLRELTAEEVDRRLAAESKSVSTRTLQDLRSILKRAITRAQARDKVKRNVVLLCELPKGQAGRRPDGRQSLLILTRQKRC